MTVSAAALGQLLDRRAGPAAPFVLNLFPDRVVAVARERLETGVRGHTSWVGHVEGEPDSTVALTWDGATLSGGVVSRGVAYDLLPAGAGSVVVVERDAGGRRPRAAGARRAGAGGARSPARRPSRRRPPGRDRSARAVHAGGARSRRRDGRHPVAARQRRGGHQHRAGAQRHQRRDRRRGPRGARLHRVVERRVRGSDRDRSRRIDRGVHRRTADRTRRRSRDAGHRTGHGLRRLRHCPARAGERRRVQRQRADLPLCRPVVLHPRDRPRLRRRPRARRLAAELSALRPRLPRGPDPHADGLCTARVAAADAQLLERGGARARRRRAAHRQLAAGQRPADPGVGGSRGRVPRARLLACQARRSRSAR